jgi:hypothetical protein
MPFRYPLRWKNSRRHKVPTFAGRLKRRSLRFEPLETRRLMTATKTAGAVASTSWFDTNVHDSNVRTLAKADFQDGVLSRADMVGLFRKIEQLGAITSTQLADMKAIVGNTSLFGTLGYVQVLSSDIALGNTANAHYQGAALGNLAVGFTSAKLEKLVLKWFYGADHPVGKSDWGPTYSYRQVAGSLFVGGVSYTDVRQGGLGDCYYLASLGELALKNPSAITSMFIVNGDGTYTVRFMHGSKAEYVTVDLQLPTDGNGYLVFDGMGAKASSTSNELWVALAEKAYVQMNECGWIRPSSWGGGQNVYTGISGGSMAQALNQVTGQSTVSYATAGSASSTFTAFASAFSAGKSICLGSNSSPVSSQIVGGHAYAVVGINTTTKTVTVFNPWGLNNGHDSGTITLAWTDIQANFGWYDRTA